jgi:predicted amidophosphoribosyltransferase
MANLGSQVACSWRIGVKAVGGSELIVVPIPSRAISHWRRGTNLVGCLAAGLCQGLQSGGLPARCQTLLTRHPLSRDQVGLAARQRGQNRQNATRLRHKQLIKQPIVLVDDIVTTGASLLDAERLLARAGLICLGAAVLAATPAKVRTNRRESTSLLGCCTTLGESGLRPSDVNH